MDVTTSDLQGHLWSRKITCLQWREEILRYYYKMATCPWTLCGRFWNAWFKYSCHFINVLEMWSSTTTSLPGAVWKLPSNAVGWGYMFWAVTGFCVSVSSSVCVRVVEMIDHSAGCFPYNVWRSYKKQRGNPTDQTNSRANAFPTEQPRKRAKE